MPDFEILCLANSRKHSGRCVAGLRTDGGGWIRPVAWNAEGTLRSHNYTLDDGTEARLLDVIQFRCIQPRPEPHHPENWLLAQSRWRLAERPASEAALGVLRDALVYGPVLLGNTEDHLPFDSFRRSPASASLALVAPQNLRWLLKTNATGERRPRILFTLGGAHYNLALTDPTWEPRLASLAPGTHPRSAAGLAAEDEVLLTISLSEPFQRDPQTPKLCYKLVAAVLVLPRSENALKNEDLSSF